MCGRRFDEDLILAQIAICVGAACTLTATPTAGILLVILFIAWSH
jgi:hypothetical protein